jgi:hypothetical protein
VAITTWADWRRANPATTVLALETGHHRDYASGAVYKDYFASPNLMFPAVVAEESPLRKKAYVFGIRTAGNAKAWPLTAFAQSPVINDRMGKRDLVLIGDANTRTVRAYERKGQIFEPGDPGDPGGGGNVQGPGGAWRITEAALVGPNGEKLARIAGHVAYWFAWQNYFGPTAELYGKP